MAFVHAYVAKCRDHGAGSGRDDELALVERDAVRRGDATFLEDDGVADNGRLSGRFGVLVVVFGQVGVLGDANDLLVLGGRLGRVCGFRLLHAVNIAKFARTGTILLYLLHVPRRHVANIRMFPVYRRVPNTQTYPLPFERTMHTFQPVVDIQDDRKAAVPIRSRIRPSIGSVAD